MRGRIAGDFSLGKFNVMLDSRLPLRPASRNADRENRRHTPQNCHFA